MLFVPNKDGQFCVCVGYSTLCKMRREDSYSLPSMNSSLDFLAHARIFSALDAYSSYWQMSIRKKGRPETVFVTHSSTHQYIRIPIGLTNVPASRRHAFDIILAKYEWKTCLVRLDKIIVFSNSIVKHIYHVDNILYSLSKAGITLTDKKCKFFSNKVEYPGRIIWPGILDTDHAHTANL